MNFKSRICCLLLSGAMLFGAMPLAASAAGPLTKGIGFVNATSLRLRSEPNTSSQILDTAYNKECVVVLGQQGDWYHVNYNLQTGYMHKDYLPVLSRENAELGNGKILGTQVNLRSGPGTGHRAVAQGNLGDTCYILGLNEGWYKVIFKGQICYIRSDFVELTEMPYENRKSPNTPKYFRGGKSTGVAPSAGLPAKPQGGSTVNGNPNTGDVSNVTGQAILNEAKRHLGAPYAWGGASPAGFDCSGFVYYVLKTLGFAPNRTPEALWSQGTQVSKDQLQPGDVVYFYGTYADRISHVGIYAGNGQFIHAPNSRSVVSYSDLTTGYWGDHYYGGRRMTK